MHSFNKSVGDIMIESDPLRHITFLAELKRFLCAISPVSKPRILWVEVSTHKNGTTFTRCLR